MHWNCDVVNEVDEQRIHALMIHDGVPKLVHGDGGDLHDSCGEKCLRDERCLHDERNDVEFCEACQGAGSEVGFGETCLCVRPSVVEMEFVVSMSLKAEPEVLILSVGHDLGQESDHVGHGGDQDLG